jgi:hypothetical protein
MLPLGIAGVRDEALTSEASTHLYKPLINVGLSC